MDSGREPMICFSHYKCIAFFGLFWRRIALPTLLALTLVTPTPALDRDGDIFTEPTFKSFRTALLIGSEEFVILGELSRPANGQYAALMFLNASRTVRSIAPIASPRLGGSLTIGAVIPLRLLLLPGGDFIVVGTAELSQPQSSPARTPEVERRRPGSNPPPRTAREEPKPKAMLEGWAARVDRNGNTLWSSVWRDPNSQLTQEYFYFAASQGPNTLVLGGKRQHDGGCSDVSKGVLLWIDPTTGKMSAPRKYFDAGSTRQGFLDGSATEDGSLLLTGWMTAEQQSSTCPEKMWLGRAKGSGDQFVSRSFAPGQKSILRSLIPLHDGTWKVAGTIEGIDGTVASAAYQFIPENLQLIARDDLRTGQASANRSFSATGLQSGAIISTGYQVLPGRTSKIGWLNVMGVFGECLSNAVFTANSSTVRDLWANSAAAGRGSVLVAGEGITTAGKPFAWLAWLGDESRAGKAIEIGQLMVEKPLALAGAAASNAPASYNFEVSSRQRVLASLNVLDGQTDAALVDADGKLLAFSDNEGAATDLIDVTLNPGRYRLAISTPAGKSTFLLTLLLGGRENPPEATDLTVLRRRLTAKELKLLGYRADKEAAIGFSATSVRAIKSFQVSQCIQPTGVLSEADARALAVTSARAEARQAFLAARAVKSALRKGESPESIRIRYNGGGTGDARMLSNGPALHGNILGSFQLNDNYSLHGELFERKLATNGEVEWNNIKGYIVWSGKGYAAGYFAGFNRSLVTRDLVLESANKGVFIGEVSQNQKGEDIQERFFGVILNSDGQNKFAGAINDILPAEECSVPSSLEGQGYMLFCSTDKQTENN